MWAEYADQLINHVKFNKQGPYIVVVQFGKTQIKFGQLSKFIDMFSQAACFAYEVTFSTGLVAIYLSSYRNLCCSVI